MTKGWINFAISFLEPRGNSDQNGDVQIFFYINSNFTYLRPFEKNPVAHCRTDGLTC